jgi:hypothetical protein
MSTASYGKCIERRSRNDLVVKADSREKEEGKKLWPAGSDPLLSSPVGKLRWADWPRQVSHIQAPATAENNRNINTYFTLQIAKLKVLSKQEMRLTYQDFKSYVH